MVVPTVFVNGVGAVALPVPPVGTVYQARLLPAAGVAVMGVAAWNWQYVTGVFTGGAAGVWFTNTGITPAGDVQLAMVTVRL